MSELDGAGALGGETSGDAPALGAYDKVGQAEDSTGTEESAGAKEEGPGVESVSTLGEGEVEDGEAKAGDAKTEDAGEGAPEAYDEWVLPEGTTASEELTNWFSGEAKELGWNQGRAQEVVDLGAKYIAKLQADQDTARAAAEESMNVAKEKYVNEQIEKVKADPLVGGDDMQAKMDGINNMLGFVVEDDGERAQLIADLRDSGMGINPGMIRLLHRFGQLIPQVKEGQSFASGKGSGEKTESERLGGLYKNSPTLGGTS